MRSAVGVERGQSPVLKHGPIKQRVMNDPPCIVIRDASVRRSLGIFPKHGQGYLFAKPSIAIDLPLPALPHDPCLLVRQVKQFGKLAVVPATTPGGRANSAPPHCRFVRGRIKTRPDSASATRRSVGKRSARLGLAVSGLCRKQREAPAVQDGGIYPYLEATVPHHFPLFPLGEIYSRSRETLLGARLGELPRSRNWARRLVRRDVFGIPTSAERSSKHDARLIICSHAAQEHVCAAA